jgi:hypothetical protein
VAAVYLCSCPSQLLQKLAKTEAFRKEPFKKASLKESQQNSFFKSWQNRSLPKYEILHKKQFQMYNINKQSEKRVQRAKAHQRE